MVEMPELFGRNLDSMYCVPPSLFAARVSCNTIHRSTFQKLPTFACTPLFVSLTVYTERWTTRKILMLV